MGGEGCGRRGVWGMVGCGWMDGQINRPKPICPFSVFEVRGLTMREWQVMSLTSSIFYHYIIWPSSVTLTFNLRKQMFWTALLILEDNKCANLFWNPCMTVPVMARTSSMYDHSDLYLNPVTLIFNLPEKIFQMALLLLEDNNCAKLFWNPCINVQVMVRTCSIYDHFNLYLIPMVGWLFWA